MSNDKTPAQAAEEEYPPRPFAQVPVHDLNGARREAFIKGAEWQASQATSKVLTDDLLDYKPFALQESDKKEGYYSKILTRGGTICMVIQPNPSCFTYGRKFGDAVIAALNAAHAPSPSLTVDQIMEVLKRDTTPYILEKTWPNELPELWQRIHDRLTDLLDQTPSPR